MEIPGIAPLSGQPTLTNPLRRESVLEGRITAEHRGSETHNTTVAREQEATTVTSAELVNELEETISTGLDTNHFGNIVDITV